MRPRSTAARLMLWYSCVLLFALGFLGFEVYSFLKQDLMRDLDQRLAQRAEGVRTVLDLEGADDPVIAEELDEFSHEVPHGELLQLVSETGDVLLPLKKEPFFPLTDMATPGQRTVNDAGFRIYVMNFRTGGMRYTVLAGEPLDDIARLMQRLRFILMALAVPTLLIAGLGGYWLIRRALAPVDEMTRAARSIGVESLSQRLPQPRTGDEIERLAVAWNELLERLENSVKRIQQFTADASHELRTPVTLIRSTAELALRRDRDPEDYRKALQEIEHEAKAMTELTESLLMLARSDSSGSVLPLAPVDLNRLVQEIARQNGVRVEAEVGDSPAVAEANEPGMRQLLRILVDNALEHTPEGGSVAVSVARQNGTVTLAVRDSGEGIPAEAVPHIFERFYRADPARTGRRVGLGLSIAQAIAQAHGSHIEVESKSGQGSCFQIALKASIR